ncbi:hypothetical protein BpHYR1_042122 [Brachionus plicatilis]|uniref:Uncharacterized protein n=1 Tax=Brachionus plicatilis TaxID=10195 RepID=A0A3M7R2C4_BRAPC|nr:hypothetical protein BpHYR1_042122 [Brachionus plicatilis]
MSHLSSFDLKQFKLLASITSNGRLFQTFTTLLTKKLNLGKQFLTCSRCIDFLCLVINHLMTLDLNGFRQNICRKIKKNNLVESTEAILVLLKEDTKTQYFKAEQNIYLLSVLENQDE